MLYRIKPNRSIDWVDMSARTVFAAVDEHGGDLDRLEWLQAERIADDATLRLALRFGRPSAVGIIVDAGDLVVLDHGRRIREAHAEAVAFRPEYRKTLEKLEVVLPGTLAEEDRSNAAVDESIQAGLVESDEDLAEAFRTPVRDSLVDHWERVGGVLPDPL
ncbi:hypothetical protein [Cellulomonas cellasea]|uniref:Uncharacterized protein n=1 Tax=Cellulomonas cellasea TaxID=43670 RepID=A0A7W4UBS3_9CELL|nr:hypothetical protein [Cellulomonas cellasea]MBB2921283.1 hypothetical protein [Cellulomonas cellasea]